MQGSGGCRDPRITTELRIETLTKLVQDLVQGSDPLDERVNNRLRHSASRFETETYTTVTSKEEYLRILSERPVTPILPNGDYIPFISGSIMLAAMTANIGAGINMGHYYSGRVINLPQNDQRPSGISGGSHHTSGEFSIRHNNSYWRQQATDLSTEHGNNNNQHPLTQPHPRLLQMRRHDHLRQQHRQNQSSSAASSSRSGQTSQSQPASVATEQVITNQMVGLPPNPFMNHDCFQHQQLVQKSSNDNVPLNSRQNQLSKNKGILESQVPAAQTESKDQPIILSESEDSNDWHDIAHKVLQRCREECFPVVSKVREHFSRLPPQGNPEGIKKMASASKEMMRFITMQRTDMVHITKDAFYSKIEKIYKFAREMSAKHPISFPKESRSTSQQNKVLQPAVIKWDFDEMAVYDFYGIDILIDLGCHMLDGRPNKRPRVEMNNRTEQSSSFLT